MKCWIILDVNRTVKVLTPPNIKILKTARYVLYFDEKEAKQDLKRKRKNEPGAWMLFENIM
jgi:hypothetical protein